MVTGREARDRPTQVDDGDTQKIVPYENVLQRTYRCYDRGMGHAIESFGPQAAEGTEPLCSDLCWLLSRASYTLTTELTAALEEMSLSPRAHHVLATALTGTYTQTELARLVGLDKTTMVVTLDELEAAGLAERRLSSDDRRARVIAVTKAGERKVRAAAKILEHIRNDVLSVLGDDEREAFVAALRRLVLGRLSQPVATAAPVRRRAPRATGTSGYALRAADAP
jgi:MarR family transcriptional regulator for hemolysin